MSQCLGFSAEEWGHMLQAKEEEEIHVVKWQGCFKKNWGTCSERLVFQNDSRGGHCLMGQKKDEATRTNPSGGESSQTRKWVLAVRE